jgi:predicted  nucleic acid-binding Zn-ribbon protein
MHMLRLDKQLEDENRLVKDLYRTTLTETDTERNRLQAELEQAHVTANIQNRRVTELEEHVKTLEARTAAVEDNADSVELHRRIQDLELALAEAKLQIVDLNCQAQVRCQPVLTGCFL